MTDGIVKYKTGAVVETPAQTEVAPANSALGMMVELAKQGIDPGQIEKMMELAERDEKNRARRAFYLAMSEFNKMDFTITKSEHVSYLNTKKQEVKYDHADLAKSLKILRMALSECGLSLTFSQFQDDKGLTVTAWLSHLLGHRESTSMRGPYDTSGGKNSIQSIGSTDSYLKRYTAFALVGVAAEKEDDDGRASEPPRYADGRELSEIMDLIEVKIKDRADYLLYAQNAHGVGASFDQIPCQSIIAIKAELVNMIDKEQI